VLGGDVKDILLVDVTPLTLSVETLGGVATPLIERNTAIPIHKSQVFSTASDSQPQVEINVLQGERPMAADNKSLGRFILDGIPPAPRGVPQVEVTFDIDANGIIKVTAQDKATQRSQHITITASSGLSESEVERMRREAEAHADDDKKRKELIEAKNMADSSIYTAEKALREFGDKVPADTRSKVESEVANVKSALESDDPGRIKSTTEQLNIVIQQIGASVYQQGGPSAGPAAGGEETGPEPGPEPGPDNGPKPGGDDDVVDGEFRNA
jgi:molecular chaperone DnaK